MKLSICILAFILIASVCFSGCTTSLVYSPSMQLPAQPLQKEQGQIGLGSVLLAETLPSSVGKKTSVGIEGFLRYGFTDKFSLQVRYWNDIHAKGNPNRAGLSVAGTHISGDSTDKYRFGLTVAAGTLLNDYTLEPLGISVIGSIWLPQFSSKFRPYTSIGVLTGFHVSASLREWGAGILVQAGVAWSVSKSCTVNLEGSFIGQANFNADISHGIPSLSLATTLNF